MLLKNGIFDRRHVFAGRGKFLGGKKKGVGIQISSRCS